MPCVWVAALLSTATLARAADGQSQRALQEGMSLGHVYNWVAAHKHFNTAEDLFVEAGDARNALFARIGRLRGEWETLSFPEVSLYLGQLLQDSMVQNDAELRLWILEAKGSADLEIDPASARRSWEEARDLATDLGETIRASRASGELGIIAFLEGDSASAVQLVATALANTVAHDDIGGHIRYLTLFGNGLSVFGRHEEAIRYFDRALRTARSHPELGTSVMALTGKARVLIEQENYKEARKLLDEALELATRRDRRGNQAELLLVFADLESRSGDQVQAFLLTRQAAELADAGGFLRLQAEAHARLAELHRKDDRAEEAEQGALASLEATRRLGDVYSLPERFAALADLRRSLGKAEDADALFEQAADILDGVLVTTDSLRSKTTLIGARSAIYVDHFNVVLNDLGDADRALQIIERARGRTAADVLRTPRDELPEPSPRRLALENEISRLQVRLMRSEDPIERKSLLDQIFDAEQDLGPLATGPDKATGGENRRPVSRQALQQALAADELLLEYVLDDSASTCLVIGDDFLRAVKLAPAPEIESLVEVFLAEVQAKRPATAVSRELHRLLIAPLADHLEGRRLIIVPDGKINLLPFEALVAKQKPLLATHVVSYAPSATVLHLLRESPGPQSDLPLLAVGDVRYEGPQETLLAAQTEARERTGGLFDIEGAQLTTLPSTAEEVASVAEAAGEGAALLVGRTATESEFKSSGPGRFRVLHLAVHGIADRQFPHRAALVFGREPDSPDDGLLQVREILNLRLGAELVTLSACDTAAGRLEGQSGITSLLRAFLIAGARSAVASLWSADDVFTTALMRRFYAKLAAGADRASALRSAKLEMLERFGDQAVPYYWAGFKLVGDGSRPIDWRPLPTEQ